MSTRTVLYVDYSKHNEGMKFPKSTGEYFQRVQMSTGER